MKDANFIKGKEKGFDGHTSKANSSEPAQY